MRRPSTVLPLLLLLATGTPSLLEATRLSLPGIPDFRLPSRGVVNTVFPAATGGAAPYSYSVSGLPPGISFHASTRGASGTLPTVSSETTYWITYGVTDGAGASASVSFSATVVPPPAPPPPPSPPPPPPPPLPPPSSLSLPTIPDFTLPSGGTVNTVFPAATGGAPPYTYGVSGLPPGVTFAAGTRRASGTLPTVTGDTDYTVTYSVRDGTGATASVTFTTTVTAPAPTIRRDPIPPGTIRPADPPTAPVDAVRLHTLPFTVSETGSGRKEYRFRLESSDQVTVSLTGMDRDIDCRVNGSYCTNRWGTSDDSWSGTLSAGTHTVTVYPYNAASGSWTLSVSGTTTSPPPAPTPSDPRPPDSGSSDHASRSRTHALRLSARFDVSVRLTGMTSDFDCRVGQSDCTNQSGTADDSWSGTLDAGEQKIVVYPRTGVSGSYTLEISVETPSTGGSEGTRTQVTTLVDVSRAGVSSRQNHSFALSRSAEVEVALTGLTIDFDCRVGSRYCTNRWGTRDDSWSGVLGEGNHSVVVYPYDPGPGNYSLTVTAITTLAEVLTPTGVGPGDMVCDQEGEVVDEDSCVQIPEGGVITVTGDDPGADPGPPPGAGPGEGDPGPGDGGDGGGGGGGGGDTETDPADEAIDACYATSLVDSERVTSNPLEDDRALGSDHGGRNTARPHHRGIDVRASRGDAVMTPVSGTVTETESGHGTNAWDAETGTFATTDPRNGNLVRIEDSAGREHVFLHLHTVGVEVGDTVTAFQQIGTANNSGNSRGDHLHYTIWRDSSRQQLLDPEGLLAACE